MVTPQPPSPYSGSFWENTRSSREFLRLNVLTQAGEEGNCQERELSRSGQIYDLLMMRLVPLPVYLDGFFQKQGQF